MTGLCNDGQVTIRYNIPMNRPQSELKRCPWTGDNQLMITYHDTEWGSPQRDDRVLFEYIILDSAQAGLSWQTILNKRENYRAALHNFDPQKIAGYTDKDRQRLLNDPGIIRNHLKIDSHIKNAQAFLAIQKGYGSFADYLWAFVENKPLNNTFRSLDEIPAKTPLAEKISKDLKRHGMTFVGPTIIYAFMQGCGMVNDHLVDCFRHSQVRA
jgi:DNA-3-methyladenine glycosylase I